MNRFTFRSRVSAFTIFLIGLVAIIGFNIQSLAARSGNESSRMATALDEVVSTVKGTASEPNAAKVRAARVSAPMTAPAATLNVDTTADIAALSACTSAPADCSLRGAVIAANSISGSTIVVPAGTYPLVTAGAGEQFAATGDLDIRATGTSIVGAGAGTTIIQQTTTDRVFETNPVPQLAGFTFSIAGVTVKDGTTTGSGAGILGGGLGSSTTITDCVFDNNSVTGALASNGGAISFTANGAANLTVSGSTFSNNTSLRGIGGAIRFSSTGTLSVTTSTFSGNRTSANSGGAINATGPVPGGTYNISQSSFVNNQALGAGSRGGAVLLANGNLNVSFSRLVGNSSGSGVGTAVSNSGPTGMETLNNNWWGVNTGPAGGDVFGTTVTSWLQLRHAASPNTICTNATSTLTADILGLSSGGPTAASNLVGLPAFPVPADVIFSNAMLGTISSASTQFVDGIATATFTAGNTAGAGSADASADNETVTASITVQETTSTTDPDDQAVCQGATATFSTTASGAGPFSYAWTLDNEPFINGDSPTINVPTGSLSVGDHTVAVTVTTTCGSASQSATLTVLANTATTDPADQTVCQGGIATFSTTASGAAPFSFVWKQGSIVLNNGDRDGRVTIVNGSTNSTLTISNVQQSDAGIYTIETTGACGTAVQSANLTVNGAPVTAVGPANVWIGLKNSDDIGTKFDLLAEVFKDGVLIGSGQINDVPGGGSGFNNAVQRTINMALAGSGDFCSGGTLSFRLSVRVAASSGHVSGTARLWYNDAAANSRFNITISGTPRTYYLHNGFVLALTPGPGPKKTIDVLVNRNQGGNPFKPFGTWSVTL